MASSAPAERAAPDPDFADLVAARPHLEAHALDGLVMDDVPLVHIARQVGTPTWVYSAGTLRRRHAALRDALRGVGLTASIHFAAKANDSLAVLRVLANQGAGADVVSEGELRAARAAGIPADRIVFSGVGKTEREIAHALAEGVMQLNAESAEEVGMIAAVAARDGRTAPVALRINPDVDARTHAKISTGLAENKFGIAWTDAAALYARMASLPGIRPVGLAVHIGSQITEGMASYRAAYARVADLARGLLSRGLPVERLDCGGGLGIPYRDEIAPTPAALAGAIKVTLGPLGLPVMLEPGRWIAGPAGVLLASVVLQKRGAARRFVVLDAAMNDLIRPAMYEAWHGILPLAPDAFHAPRAPADVVGPVCESGDTFARGRDLPDLPAGSLVAFLDAGAYGSTMSSTYNARPLAAEVLVDGARWAVTRPRQTHEALLAGQADPGLAGGAGVTAAPEDGAVPPGDLPPRAGADPGLPNRPARGPDAVLRRAEVGPRTADPIDAPRATDRPTHPALRRLASLRGRARLALLWESVWPRLWPVLGVVGVFLLLALSGLFLRLSPVLHLILLAVLITALIVAVLRAARGLSLPGDDAADRRLERDSGLPHRPLTALLDRPAGNDPAAAALWRVHQGREAARIARLRAALPRPGLPARDPRALRTGLAVALVAALVAAGSEAPERLRRALWPAVQAASIPAIAARVEAWVTPPAYTGAAPVFLDPAGGSATVPAGSRLRVALSGGLGAPELLRDGAEAAPFTPLGAGSHLSETTLDAGGRIAVRQGVSEVAAWSLAVQADAPPRIAFAEPPAPAQRGLATRLPWRAEDDWGVASARAELRLQARPDAPPLTVELSVPPGRPKTPRGVAQPDLSAHPWAGLPVRARLVARDGAEQEGVSEEAALTLPERSFNHPVAQRLIALRKGLSLAPEARQVVIDGLDRLAEAPAAFENDTATTLALRSSRTRLSEDLRPEAVGEVQQTMWEAALALEEGRADRTAGALARAREALRQALRERREAEARDRTEQRHSERDRAAREEAGREAEARDREAREQAERDREAEARGEPRDQAVQEQERAEREQAARQREEAARQREQAAQERAEAERQAGEQERNRQEERNSQRAETDRRIRELRDAIRRHLEALAEQLQRENGESQPDPQAGQQQRRETDRRTSRMREQNRQDRPEEAERELAELERMLDQLENGEMAQAGREQQRQRRERGQQQMGVIQDMVRRQTRLLDGAHRRAEDDTARRAQERRQSFNNWNRWPPPPPPANQPSQQALQDQSRDARTQRALRRALGELMQQHGDLTGEVPAPLGRADQAMREGAEALSGSGDPRPHQERAIRELSEGGRQMAQRMQRQFGQQQPGEGEEPGEGEGGGDMLAEGGEEGGEGQDQLAQQGEGRDPLGRRMREANGTNEEGGDTRVPDEAEMLRTRRIQEELRKRGAERERPATELDYIDRLLRQF